MFTDLFSGGLSPSLCVLCSLSCALSVLSRFGFFYETRFCVFISRFQDFCYRLIQHDSSDGPEPLVQHFTLSIVYVTFSSVINCFMLGVYRKL